MSSRAISLPLFSLFILLSQFTVTNSLKVVELQEDGVATMSSEAVYNGDLSRHHHIYSLTLCARFKIYYLHTRGNLFRLRDPKTRRPSMLAGEIWVDKIRFVNSHSWHFMPLENQLWAYRWYHVCFTYENTTGRMEAFINGEKVHKSHYIVNRPVFGDNAIAGNGEVAEESFSGLLTQINVWDRVLTTDTINKMAACEVDLQGNFISWDAEWIINEGTLYDFSLYDICQETTSTTYFFFSKITEITAQYMCEALGTHLPVPVNQKEVDILFEAQNSTWPESEMCIKYWSNLDDKRNENVWVRNYDNRIIEDMYWAPDEPNGNRYENCGFVKRGGVFDDDCAWPKCVVCTFTEPQRFSFRGTCEKELRHVYFVAYQEAYGELVFKGYGSYQIEKVNDTWHYLDTVKEEILAVMEPFGIDYPMGRRSWRLEKNMCDQEKGDVKTLLLTPCNVDQYSCDDATCIPLRYRCDLKYDCRDLSDEQDCELIAFPDDYQQRLPPRVPRVENSSVAVELTVKLKSINVYTVDMAMKLSYELELEWLDGRLEFLNLKANDSLNSPKVNTMMKLWSPIIRLINTDTIDNNLLARDASTIVRRSSKPVRRDDSVPAEIDIYSGEENPLMMVRKYSTVYTCNFDLTLYPFDNQVCDMNMQIVSGRVSFLEVHENSSVTYFGSNILNEYEIGGIHLILGGSNAPSVVRVRIPLIRLYGHAFLNIYIPSLILLIISYLTLFFRKSFFDTRVMAALTSLLVLATLFAQASASLPKTSYFKVVDVWILFCVIMTFLVTVFHILIDNQLFFETKVKSFNALPDGGGNNTFKKYLGWVARINIQNLELKAKIFVFTLIVIFILCYVLYIFFKY